MPQFIDGRGRRWRFLLDAPLIDLVRLDGIDLLDSSQFQRLVDDDLLAISSMSALLTGQHGLSEPAIMLLFDNEPLRRKALVALARAVEQWFPTSDDFAAVAPSAPDEEASSPSRQTLFGHDDPVIRCYAFAGLLGVSPRGLTYRQLWLMFQGAQQAGRARIASQADLVALSFSCGGMEGETLQEFICSGHTPSGIETMEYDQDTLKQIVVASGGRMGDLN